jgi:hypothetical protein
MALGPPAGAREQNHGKVDIASLSADRARVTDGDVLLAVDGPARSRSKISASSGTALT